jgi:hypothetical protein
MLLIRWSRFWMPSFLKKRFYVCLQPRLFVGRGMHEGAFSLFKYVKLLTHLHIVLSRVTSFSFTEHCCPDRYTMFWIILLAMKLIVSFYIEVTFISCIMFFPPLLMDAIFQYPWTWSFRSLPVDSLSKNKNKSINLTVWVLTLTVLGIFFVVLVIGKQIM